MFFTSPSMPSPTSWVGSGGGAMVERWLARATSVVAAQADVLTLKPQPGWGTPMT